MGKIRQKLAQFMYGRYGIDTLYYVLLTLYAVIVMFNIFIDSTILSIALWVLLIYMFFRVFSKNISARRKENNIIVHAKNKVVMHFTLIKKKFNDRKTKRYRKCPECKTILRLPIKKGKNNVLCPKCKTNFKVNIMW